MCSYVRFHSKKAWQKIALNWSRSPVFMIYTILRKKILFWRLSLASVHVGLITLHPTISEVLRSCPTYSADASRGCLPLCIWFWDMHMSEIGIFLSSSTESPRLVQPQTKIHTDLYLSGSFKPRNSRLFQQLQNSFIQITYPLKKKCLLQYSSPCWSYLTFTLSSWTAALPFYSRVAAQHH